MMSELRFSPSALRGYVASPGWPRHLVGLAALAAAILLLFAQDALDMVRIWWTSSTYGHCLFIPFLIGWLVHQRAAGLRQLDPVAWPPGLVWLAGGALCWLLGDAAGLAVLRHGGLVVMLQGAVIVTLGPAVSRALLFPLFYAFFMVPLGSELEPALQLITAEIAMTLLGLAGVPAHIEGIFITTPTGYFEVAEACSGAKFVVAVTAYGVLVCNVCFRSWIRRALFLVSALVLCIVANGFRAFATIFVAEKTSIDAAVGFDHIIYGWLFFALVMAGVMATAWPFFDRKPGDQSFDAHALQGMAGRAPPLSTVIAVALFVAIVAPAWSHISALRGQAELAAPALPHIPGWSRSNAPMAAPWKPRFDGADYHMQARYADGKSHIVDLAIATYARQSEGRELIGFGQGAVDPDGEWVWSAPAPAPANARGETITAPGPVVRHVVNLYRVGGSPLMGAATQVKLATMKARLLGQDQRAIAILISAEKKDGAPANAAIEAFLHDLGSLDKVADASLRAR
tara:strand:+ start:92003 stop:93544 length:1542 start_codon:yes stop_codon:yes gene_type:complete